MAFIICKLAFHNSHIDIKTSNSMANGTQRLNDSFT